MNLQDFIQNFADQFDETEQILFKEETVFKDLDEWSSIVALSIIAMVDEEYSVRITGDDIKDANSIGDLYNIVKKRK